MLRSMVTLLLVCFKEMVNTPIQSQKHEKGGETDMQYQIQGVPRSMEIMNVHQTKLYIPNQ